MLRYIYGDQLSNFSKLQDTMHRDRAIQFRDRLKWDVNVDENGWERDEYDDLNPLYVIWENERGEHGVWRCADQCRHATNCRAIGDAKQQRELEVFFGGVIKATDGLVDDGDNRNCDGQQHHRR